MPETLLEFPEGHAGLGAVHGVRVSQVVEPDVVQPGSAPDLLPGVTQCVGRDGTEEGVRLLKFLFGDPGLQGFATSPPELLR